mmetsp:Transcript_20582/g.60114  ORF Transcript_20582/g.60114 Transcript_20582/m.60114 type:complete len:205 (-) Transcript_20582:305-919(-)
MSHRNSWSPSPTHRGSVLPYSRSSKHSRRAFSEQGFFFLGDRRFPRLPRAGLPCSRLIRDSSSSVSTMLSEARLSSASLLASAPSNTSCRGPDGSWRDGFRRTDAAPLWNAPPRLMERIMSTYCMSWGSSVSTFGIALNRSCTVFLSSLVTWPSGRMNVCPWKVKSERIPVCCKSGITAGWTTSFLQGSAAPLRGRWIVASCSK